MLTWQKLSITTATASLLFASSLAAEDVTGPDAVQCGDGTDDAFVLVNIHDIATVEGNIRAQVYSDKESEFLEKGKKLVRIDVPVTDIDLSLCVPLPSPGNFSLVILHDKNANGKADFFSEGFGFANNPKLRFGPPDVEDATFVAAAGVTEMDINLKYILGSDTERKKKRRSLRRRR